jgi:3-deoxy-manno-octulosonate cytidylyltransferase (CMP-KDO synthetase)
VIKSNIIGVIPAHMSSVRFPQKILHPIMNLPMIEHVRRRAELSTTLNKVYVATCDKEIAEVISKYGGNVIMTSSSHQDGTSRVAEAIKKINCSHVVLLQGDEPLLIPKDIDYFVKNIKNRPLVKAWNAVANLSDEEELDKNSFVKCSINSKNRILYCFRRSPGYSSFQKQKKYIKKILGLIAYRKDFLTELEELPESLITKYEYIEQMKIIENNTDLFSVELSQSLPSINEPNEVSVVVDYLKKSNIQKSILKNIIENYKVT